MKKGLLLSLLLVSHLCAFAQSDMWDSYGKTLNVKGGIGIEQFVTAIFNTKPGEWSTDAVYDKRNGYFRYHEEGDGSVTYNVSYWNRKDGKKLVIMAYRENNFGKKVEPMASAWGYFSSLQYGDLPTDIINMETGFRAYIYDVVKKQLVPLATPPFNGLPTPLDSQYFLELPQEGKDIVVCETVDYLDEIKHSLRWNGMTFDFEKGERVLASFYLTDTKANIRTAPNGKILKTLPGTGEYTVDAFEIKDGWCRIGQTIYENTEGKDIKLSDSDTGQYWIHHSRLGATAVAATAKLRATPDMDGEILMTLTEDSHVTPLEIRGVWVKVRESESKKEGWVLSDELCSNPLTVCC